MVKVSELGNQQLLKQILKYRKILDVLLKERESRLARGHPGAELYSAQELAEIRAISSAPKPVPQEAAPESSAPKSAPETFQLEIDVEEIERMRSEEEQRKAAKDDGEEEVRVTQLIKLSKGQLDELRKESKKNKK